MAISADGRGWFLLNASPEIRQQIEAFPPLHPRDRRHSPIQGVLLTNGDLDHCLGLLSLRESHPLLVYATERVRVGFIERNVFYRTLERFPGQVTWRILKPGRREELVGVDGRESGLVAEALPVPGKPPVHLEGLMRPDPEDNVGVRIRDEATGGTLAYMSAVGALTDSVRQALDGADCVFFDGTFWSSDELRALGLGEKLAEDMAHLPVGGPTGSARQLAKLGAARKIYIHLNNTNPLLREDSPERASVTTAGWEIAHDGMEITL